MRKWIGPIVALIAVVVPAAGAIWHDIRPALAAQDHVVGVQDSDRDETKWKWVPEEVTVAVGDTVTWDMAGAKLPHSSTADDGSWDSGYVTPGEKWTHTFDKSGDFHYHCTPHPWKKGIVHVK
jgi:plastocyanin